MSEHKEHESENGNCQCGCGKSTKECCKVCECGSGKAANECCKPCNCSDKDCCKTESKSDDAPTEEASDSSNKGE